MTDGKTDEPAKPKRVAKKAALVAAKLKVVKEPAPPEKPTRVRQPKAVAPTPTTKATAKKAASVPKKTAAPVASPKTERDVMTQDDVKRILDFDPKVGRDHIAKELQLPAAWVWRARVVAGWTKVGDAQRDRCRAYFTKHGLRVPGGKMKQPWSDPPGKK